MWMLGCFVAALCGGLLVGAVAVVVACRAGLGSRSFVPTGGLTLHTKPPPTHTHTQNLLAKNKRTARTVWYKTMEQGDLVYIFPDAMRAGAIEQHVRLASWLYVCILVPHCSSLCDRAHARSPRSINHPPTHTYPPHHH